MNPKKYTQKGDVVIFHYDLEDLLHFVRRGKEFGDVGMILVKRNGSWNTYKGFGTIDHPLKEMCSITMNHHPLFDGEMLTPEEIVNFVPKKPEPLKH